MSPRIQTIVEEKQSGPNLLEKKEEGGIEFTMRKHYDKEFKVKVTLEAIKGEKTIQELATLYSVHPNLLAMWKEQLEENAPELFERSQKDKEKEAAEHKEEELYKEICQLQVENEFLKKVQTIVRDSTTMVEPKHPVLSIRQQCVLLGISKGNDVPCEHH